MGDHLHRHSQGAKVNGDVRVNTADVLRDIVERELSEADASVRYPILSDGWTFHTGPLPNDPKCVTFNNLGGRPPHPTLLLDYPMVQAYIRGKRLYSEGFEAGQELKNILLGRPPEGGHEEDRLVAINMESDILFVQEDVNSVPEFSVTFALITEPYEGVGASHREPLPRAAVGT